MLRVRERDEPEFRIDAVSVRGGQEPLAGSEVRMVQRKLDHLLREASSAMPVFHPNIAKISKPRLIRNDPKKTDLCTLAIRAYHQGRVVRAVLDPFD